MSEYLVNKDSKSSEGIGGKARNLLRLEEKGISVPRWAVISEEVLLNQLPAKILNDEVIEAFQALSVSPNLIAELQEFFGSDYDQKTYAVRSSAVDEDGSKYSFAGQFETYLHVPFSEIETRISDIWKSVISEQVLNYRRSNNLPIHLGIGVIVQEMIEPDVSGVGFGLDPMTGQNNTHVISALYGLGEGLVSGQLNADTFTVKSDEVIIGSAKKEYKLTRAKAGSGVEKQELDAELQEKPCLNEGQVLEVSGVLNELQELFGSPQDIEFAFAGEKLFLLQARPITATGKKEKGEYILWDNSNIIESYPGVTTPLTFSFIVKMYERVYRQFVQLLGVKQHEIDRHEGVFANTLGLVRGRVYYNLLSWYKMLAMVPGYSINAEYMETMMGVKERFELPEDYRMSKGLAWFRIVLMVFQMIALQVGLPRERRKFMAHLNKVINAYKLMDFSTMNPAEIIAKYNQFEQTLLLQWKAPLINDFFAMIWFGMLKKQCQKHFPNEPNIHNDLLCGSADIVSVEPVHRCMEIARMVAETEDAEGLFNSKSPEEIWAQLTSGKLPDIKKAIDEYIDKFGERCVGELKLETVSYAQDPTLFIGVVKSYVAQGVVKKASTSDIDQQLRIKAEAKVKQGLKSRPLARWWFNVVLRQARSLVSNRENLRYERTRGFGMVRRMFRALGEHWHEQGHLDLPEDVFYLELFEIKALEHSDFGPDLKRKIAQRKEEFETYRQQEAPKERFFTYGFDFRDEYIYSTEKLEAVEGDLQGIGCCPGRVKARARVVMDPTECNSLEGDILVTSSTDPGWVTLFPTASGIIVERGSLLSHSAIVSREMGIPCIVGVTGLLRSVKTGDELIMDGSTGLLKIASHA